MRKRIIRRKPIVVDGQKYEVSVSAIYDDVVKLRVTVRADFGTRSFVMIDGLRNFDYYYNYGYWTDESYSEPADTIQITPRILVNLIRFARENGWSPETEKPNRRLEITNTDARSLMDGHHRTDENGTSH